VLALHRRLGGRQPPEKPTSRWTTWSWLSGDSALVESVIDLEQAYYPHAAATEAEERPQASASTQPDGGAAPVLRTRRHNVIERLDGAPAGVLAFKAVGEVTVDDYTQVLKPALDTALSGGRKIRGVFLLGPEFTGYSSGAKLEDLGLGLGFMRKWARCAVVTDAQWIHDLMRRFGWLMGRRLRQFPVAELPAAMKWAAGE
jgi:hypothetical protein